MNHKFVEFIPSKIEEGVLYISIEYSTAVHSCCCGCGKEVVTPFSPTDWKFIFDGNTVSLYPSIGNWSYECKSHYWINENRVEWSYKFSEEKIRKVRKQDKVDKDDFYKKSKLKKNKEENRLLFKFFKKKNDK